MKETLKDIKTLTSGLYGSQSAGKVAEELFEADRHAWRFETLTPDARLIAAIKADVASELSAKRNPNRWILRAIAMAACVVFAYTLSTRLYFDKQVATVPAIVAVAPVVSTPVVAVTMPVDTKVVAGAQVAMVWDDESDQVSMLSTRLNNIETALYRSDDNLFESEYSITEIETQVNDLQGLFWKG